MRGRRSRRNVSRRGSQLCRIGSLQDLPSRDLRAVGKDTNGKHRAGSSRRVRVPSAARAAKSMSRSILFSREEVMFAWRSQLASRRTSKPLSPKGVMCSSESRPSAVPQ